MFRYLVNSELPGYDEKIQQRYIYVQNLYRRYSIEKIYRHPKRTNYCVIFHSTKGNFLVYGYNKELSVKDPDKRTKAFEHALAKDFASYEYITEQKALSRLLLLLANNKQVRQLYRQRIIHGEFEQKGWEEYRMN